MPKQNEIITNSPEETMGLAQGFAALACPGDMIALLGELGAGKTLFVKGFAKGLGVEEYNYVNSPSFVVVKEYQGKMPLYHFDVYRLDEKLFSETVDHEKYFYSEGVSVVEWANKIQPLLPEEYVEISIEYLKGDERLIKFKAVGEKYRNTIEKFFEELTKK